MTVSVGFPGLVIPPTVTLTVLVHGSTAVGTRATICVLLQLVMEVAATPLNCTELVPWVAPKFDPVIVTEVPTPTKGGDTDVTNGVVPIVRVTLSNVLVATAVVERFDTPRPTKTV
jgi:hypothetical protein